MRRGVFLLASSIPRSVWDPQHANLNWTDSYATPIADRRHWPSKRWSVGLEPRTPSEWLTFSYRNLAYAYNGALRACSTFPEMLVYYKEMKLRKVKVDIDTMNIMLSRAARYERMEVDDMFMLFDEMLSLGVRPDLASVEILHTVWEHSVGKPAEWRETRRRQLIQLYNYLAHEEIVRLSKYHVDPLLSAQMERFRSGVRQLQSRLSPSIYQKYLTHVDCAWTLLHEVHNFMWEFVPADHPAIDLPALQMRIPFIASVLHRPDLKDNLTSVAITDFEDYSVCAIFQSALERCVDRDFHDNLPFSERRLFLSLLTMLTSSGVLYTRDLMAQFMDVIKYSRDEGGSFGVNSTNRNTGGALSSCNRDNDAIRVLRYCLRGSSAVNDDAYRVLWRQNMFCMDGRIVGRYIASRSPWSPIRFCFDEHYQFHTYAVAPLLNTSAEMSSSSLPVNKEHSSSHSSSNISESSLNKMNSNEGANDTFNGSVNEDENTSDPVIEDINSSTNLTLLASETQRGERELRTAEALQLRWDDIQQLIRRTKVLENTPYENNVGSYHNNSESRTSNGRFDEKVCHGQSLLQHKMEVFTGQAVFLRSVATGVRYGSIETTFTTQAIGDMEDERNDDNFSRTSSHQRGLTTSGADSLSLRETNVSVMSQASSSLFAQGLSLEVWQRLYALTHQLYDAQERFIQTHTGAEPELECWESMLIVLRCVLDYAVVNRRDNNSSKSNFIDSTVNNNSIGSADDITTLFTQAAQMRAKLIEESRTRFDGRMKILWLHEV